MVVVWLPSVEHKNVSIRNIFFICPELSSDNNFTLADHPRKTAVEVLRVIVAGVLFVRTSPTLAGVSRRKESEMSWGTPNRLSAARCCLTATDSVNDIFLTEKSRPGKFSRIEADRRAELKFSQLVPTHARYPLETLTISAGGKRFLWATRLWRRLTTTAVTANLPCRVKSSTSSQYPR